MKRTVLLLVIMSSVFAFARGKHVTLTVLASTQVGGMSRGECVGKLCYTAARSTAKEIAVSAEMDGRHVLLYCNDALEPNCAALKPGTYKGKLESDEISIKARVGDGRKSKTIKYSIR
jgi:hypothetical protein